MKTIVQFIDNLATGGKERQCAELVKVLSRRGDYRVHVVAMVGGAFADELTGLPRVSLHYLPRRIKYDPLLFLRLWALCRPWRPDLITVWDSMTGLYALPAARLLGMRYVSAIVQDAPPALSATLRRRSRMIFAAADAVVANSAAGARVYAAPAHKTTIIRTGYDLARMQHAGDPVDCRRQFGLEQALVVGMVATFSHYKDQPTLVRAARAVRQRRTDVAFVMVGGGPTLEAVRALLTEEERGYIRLLGRVDHDIEALVGAFDVGVLATFTEGISNSILEYMIQGKPVVATDGGGTSELVVDGETGFLVRAGDADDLAGRILTLLEDPALRQRLGARGRERVEREFLLEHTLDKYCTLYDQLLGAS